MIKTVLAAVLVLLTLNIYGQAAGLHYIKFLHVGEKLEPVNTINITYIDQEVPRDPVERVIDSLPPKSIITDEISYNTVLKYIKGTSFKLGKSPGRLYFGTFKIIAEGQYFYLPGNSVTRYFKNMVAALKKKGRDPQLIQALVDNYPWIFNP